MEKSIEDFRETGLFHEGVKVEVNGDPQNINLLIHQKKARATIAPKKKAQNIPITL